MTLPSAPSSLNLSLEKMWLGGVRVDGLGEAGAAPSRGPSCGALLSSIFGTSPCAIGDEFGVPRPPARAPMSMYFKPVLILAYPREPPAHGGWLPRHLPRRPSQHDPNFFRPSVARAATKSRRNISSRRDMLYILAALLEEPKV